MDTPLSYDCVASPTEAPTEAPTASPTPEVCQKIEIVTDDAYTVQMGHWLENTLQFSVRSGGLAAIYLAQTNEGIVDNVAVDKKCHYAILLRAGNGPGSSNIYYICNNFNTKIEVASNSLRRVWGNAYRAFWISFANGRIRVGQGDRLFVNEFMNGALQHSPEQEFVYFGISTLIGFEGYWMFCDVNECAEESNICDGLVCMDTPLSYDCVASPTEAPTASPTPEVCQKIEIVTD